MNAIAVRDVFAAAQLQACGPVRWGEPVPELGSGIYVVALSDAIDAEHALAVEHQALRSRWLANQPIVYIGRSKGLQLRLRQFYRHKHGAKSPHRGGQNLLLLKCPLWIHWAATNDYVAAEHAMLECFKVQAGSFPFANRVRAARSAAADTARTY